MKISGFTFVRNANNLYLPIVGSINSVLPIVDEFVVVVGKGDENDQTLEWLKEIKSEKLKIFHSEWNIEQFPKNTIYAQQTDLAKSKCTGDWLFYMQGDEAIHDAELSYLKACIERASKDKRIEGITLKYKHFWGDYQHYHYTHNWYSKEIRIIKNHPNIHSWGDAQSFRMYDKKPSTWCDYKSKEGNRKLNTASAEATVFHYGYVRPPEHMTTKRKSSFSSFHGKEKASEILKNHQDLFDYGPLQKLKEFKGSHPKSMSDWIAKFDWKEHLQFSGSADKSRPIHKHEKFKYRFLGWIEQKFLNGKTIGGIKNYREVAKY